MSDRDRRRKGHQREEKPEFEDVVIVTDGKKLKAHSSLLVENSEIFAEELKAQLKNEFPPHELDMRGRRSEDVALVLSYLKQRGSRDDLKGENVWRVLPIVAEYKMSQLKKRCGQVLFDTFVSKCKKQGSDRLPTTEGLRYLAAAEKHGFGKLKTLCIEELAKCHDVTARKEIIDDEHISWKLKVDVLDSMFDAQSDDTEQRLNQIQHRMEVRCSETERRRKEYTESMEKWKAELRKETDQMKKEIDERHRWFAEDLRSGIQGTIDERMSKLEKELADNINDTLSELKKSIKQMENVKYEHLKTLEELNTDVLKNIEKADNALKLQIRNVLKSVKDKATESLDLTQTAASDIKFELDKCSSELSDCTKNAKNSLWKYLLDCHYRTSVDILTSSGILQEETEQLNEALASKIRAITEIELKTEAAKIELQRVKADLFLYKKKWTTLNTWLKWACPVDDEDETKCKCRRHAATPRV